MKNIGLFFLFMVFISLNAAEEQFDCVMFLEGQRGAGQPFECLPCSLDKRDLVAFSSFQDLEKHRNEKDCYGQDIPTVCHHRSMVALYHMPIRQQAYKLLGGEFTQKHYETVKYVINAYREWKQFSPFLCVTCAVFHCHCTAFGSVRDLARHQKSKNHYNILQDNRGDHIFDAQCEWVALILNIPN